MHKAYVLLGGNEGDVPAMFRKAVGMIQDAGILVITKGSLYESAAWGDGVHGTFYNQLLVLSVNQKPHELLSVLLDIESRLGRNRHPGVVTNRTIDIDILFIDDLVLADSGISVPHPRLHLRRFALIPLCELVPGLIHPVIGKTMEQLLNDTPDNLVVKKAETQNQPGVSPL